MAQGALGPLPHGMTRSAQQIAANRPHVSTCADISVHSCETPSSGVADQSDPAVPDTGPSYELVLVDRSVDGYEQLVRDLRSEAETTRRFEVVLLDTTIDGIQQISDVLNSRNALDAIHIVSHGTDRAVQLGATWLSHATLVTHAAALASWASSLSKEADLLFYGCQLASSSDGRRLLNAVQTLTGADIAASTDATGATILGGDWDLEFETGTIESQVAFSDGLQNNWHGILATFVVTNTNASGAGSLRQAIINANSLVGLDNIEFNLSASDPRHYYYTDDGSAGQVSLGNITTTTAATDALLVNPDPDFAKSWYSIALTDGLSPITSPVILDGSTQPGFSGTPIIEVDGTGATGGSQENLVTLEAGSSTIRGLVLNRFLGDDTIEIDILGGNLIVGNYFGTDVSGTIARPGDYGFNVHTGNNQIGGTTAADCNIISGYNHEGIWIYTTPGDNNIVSGNYIGVDATGAGALGNGSHGIFLNTNADGNLIGGTTAGAGNVIAHNGSDGIYVNSVAGTGNHFLGNRIYANGGLGIDLGTDGVTANDAGDSDSGPNNLQNFAVLTSAEFNGGSTATVHGSLNSTASTTFRLEFFASTSADASGHGEAERYLGSTTVVTDGSGNVSFSTMLAGVAAGEFITSTATVDVGGGNFSHTSELSNSVIAIDPSQALWLSTDGNVTGSGIPGLDAWTDGEIIRMSNPNLTFGTVTSGTFSSVFDIDQFADDSNTAINGMHYVSQAVVVGSGGNTVSLQAGDVLLTTEDNEDFTSTNTISVNDDEIFAFRPDVAGDYSSGTFIMVADNLGSIHGEADT
ncbi:hypothetical protein C2W62_13580 [Candidatus Entotheonella serta]|nr:hypothetical protein C2W62_13580 [Candidatus Entotheonella serta]